MARRRTVLLVLVALVAAVLALGGRAPGRVLPRPDPVEAPPAPGTLVVDLVDGATEADREQVAALLGAPLDWVSPLAVDEALAVGEVADLEAATARLAGHPLVEVVEPSIVLHTQAWPDDPLYPRQWNLRAIGAEGAWRGTPRGKGIVVAVLDTGVTVVEDLEGTHVLPGFTFVPGTLDARDDNGHGTHVAGTIAQTTHNGKGVAGVAPAATILPIKVLSATGSGQSAWIAAGIDHAVDSGAKVINLSLGGPYSRVVHLAVQKARRQGVLVVAAVGNAGRRGVSFPGGLKETLGVSAVGPDGRLAPYSSWGEGVDLAAPGGDKRRDGGGILQDTVDLRGGHHYVELQGTSMATPHVAGAAATLLSMGMDPAAAERILLRTARGGGWEPRLGHGTLDLGTAAWRVGRGHGAARAALAAGLAVLVTALGTTGVTFRVLGVLVAALVAGGAFFLPGAGSTLPWSLIATPLLGWPGLALGPEWNHFPLWISALPVVVAAVLLLPVRPSRPLLLGLCAGVAGHLLHGAATGTLNPWWLPWGLDQLWLGLNATLALVLAMAVAGAETLDRRRRW